MNANLLTQNIWQTITSTTKKCKTASYVAVAYFGTGAAKMLPLKEGDKLVVDASDGAVKSGQTNPDELIKLYKAGVEIYSHQCLHAKVFVIGTRLFIGSTNVSSRSSDVLQEAVFSTTDRSLVHDSKDFVKSLCKNDLGFEYLNRLKKIYNPPKVSATNNAKRKGKAPKEGEQTFWVLQLAETGYTKGYEKEQQKGELAAKKKRKVNIRHVLTEFELHGKKPVEEGDWVLQVTETGDGTRTFISPFGRVHHIERWRDDKGGYITLEIPNKRRKDWNRVTGKFDSKERTRLGLDCKLNTVLAGKISEFWQ